MIQSIQNLQKKQAVRYAEVVGGGVLVVSGARSLLAAKTQSAASTIVAAASGASATDAANANASLSPKVSTQKLAISGAVQVAAGLALAYLGLKK